MGHPKDPPGRSQRSPAHPRRPPTTDLEHAREHGQSLAAHQLVRVVQATGQGRNVLVHQGGVPGGRRGVLAPRSCGIDQHGGRGGVLAPLFAPHRMHRSQSTSMTLFRTTASAHTSSSRAITDKYFFANSSFKRQILPEAGGLRGDRAVTDRRQRRHRRPPGTHGANWRCTQGDEGVRADRRREVARRDHHLDGREEALGDGAWRDLHRTAGFGRHGERQRGSVDMRDVGRGCRADRCRA